MTNVIYGIAAKAAGENEFDNVCSTEGENSDSGYSTQLHPGEHIIAFWVEGNDIKWYLGIVDYMKDDKAIISYMARADSAGRSWVFPEKADIQETSFDQIISTKVKVHYSGSVRIRCQIESDLIDKMNNMVKLHK